VSLERALASLPRDAVDYRRLLACQLEGALADLRASSA
jgi:hypothetical protein